MRLYIALIRQDKGSDYGVSFPDFPGCITAAVTLDEARALAEESLAFHVKGMVEDGQAIPEPSSLDSVMGERENRDAVAVLVPLRGDFVKVVRVNVTIPEDVLDRIDRYATDHGFNRSGFLTHAAKKAMEAA